MTSLFLKDYIDLLEEAEMCEYLTPKEESFIESLRENYDEYRNGCFVSEKQIDWLESIVNKG